MAQASSLALLFVAAVAGAAHARPQATYIQLPATPSNAFTSTQQGVSSNIVYLRRCPVGSGCFIHPGGSDDSRTDTSSIAGGQVAITEFKQGDQVWADTVACVKTTFAPFGITVTDVDPGNVPHFENIVGGSPEQLMNSSVGSSAGGVAPFTCAEIPNAIVYTFDVYGPDAAELCWTSAQEVAHAFGLDHEFLQKDPMTYLAGDYPKRFRDVDADCGEFSARACTCSSAKQNSYRKIVALFGPGAPTPPEITVQRPADGKEIQPGFRVTLTAEDDVRVDKVELLVDGNLASMTMMPSSAVAADKFDLSGPTDLAMGAHTLEIRATDVQGVPASVMLAVTQGPPCTASKGCTGTDVCVSGICLPGPGEPGGLGSKCQSDNECLSHKCTDAQEAFKHCTEACDVNNADSCPSEFECLPAGATGACWPNPSGGCCDTGTAPQGPLLLGLGLSAFLLRRRRRRVPVS